MSKKLFAACLVIAAFAVVPSLASANPILTEPTGTALTGTPKITATNVGAVLFTTSVGTLTCSTAILTGNLISNATATGVKGEITAVKVGGTNKKIEAAEEPECTGTGFFAPGTTVTPNINLPWCLEAPAATDTFTLKGGPCGAQRAIKFNLDVTEVGTCEYSRTATVSGTISTDGEATNPNTASISEAEWTKAGGPFLCPGSGKLDMTFSLETDNAEHQAIFISS
jgi:hypothetical protein